MKSNEILNICCCTDDNYAQHCGVTLCSLFENNPDKKFTIHLLINTLLEDNRKALTELVKRYNSEIIFYNVNAEKLKGCQYRINRPLSEAAYYRVLLSSIIPENIDTILYLDCDIVVTGNVSELFEIDINGYPLAAVQDPGDVSDDHRHQLSIPYGESYFNSGVLLINLKYWRENNCEPKLLKFSKRERRVFCHDQDALNFVFKKKWYRLPPKWNKSNSVSLEQIEFANILDKREYIKAPRIIHYIDEPKPWYNIRGTKYRRLYKKYLSISRWNSKKTQIGLKRTLIFYKRVAIARFRSLLYFTGFQPLFRNIRFIWFWNPNK